MPSPFPGMNPYLEQPDVWHDFHAAFLPKLRAALVAQVGNEYVVSLEAHVYVRELSAKERQLIGRADVGVSGTRKDRETPSDSVLAMAPVIGVLPTAVDILRESYLEVRRRESRELVTVIELLSPSNKNPGVDRDAYVAKRRVYSSTGNVNFVELDLLRGGRRMPTNGLPQCDYCVLVARAMERPSVGLWPLSLRDRLPEIPIPLRAPSPDARVDLQELLHQVYEEGGYATYVYEGSPVPPLDPQDSTWADAIVMAASR
jgi:hypothetical protein